MLICRDIDFPGVVDVDVSNEDLVQHEFSQSDVNLCIYVRPSTIRKQASGPETRLYVSADCIVSIFRKHLRYLPTVTGSTFG